MNLSWASNMLLWSLFRKLGYTFRMRSNTRFILCGGYVSRLRKLSIRKKCKGKTTENNPESLLRLHRPPDNCSGSMVMSSDEELKLGQVKLFKVLGP